MQSNEWPWNESLLPAATAATSVTICPSSSWELAFPSSHSDDCRRNLGGLADFTATSRFNIQVANIYDRVRQEYICLEAAVGGQAANSALVKVALLFSSRLRRPKVFLRSASTPGHPTFRSYGHHYEYLYKPEDKSLEVGIVSAQQDETSDRSFPLVGRNKPRAGLRKLGPSHAHCTNDKPGCPDSKFARNSEVSDCRFMSCIFTIGGMCTHFPAPRAATEQFPTRSMGFMIRGDDIDDCYVAFC